MDTQKRIICRLCLKVCDSFKAIDGELKGVLDKVVKKIDFTTIQEPIMCTYCAAMLIKCSKFKTTCLNARDCILPFTNKEADLKFNLKEVYLSMNENGIGLSEAQDICGFCMSPVKSCSAISFDVVGGDITLQNMIEQCVPELDFSIIKKPVICSPCHDTLESCFCFVTNCSIVEKKIKKYHETQDLNGEGQTELSSLLKFLTNDVLIKVEKKDERKIGSECDTLKVEQIMFCNVNESVNEHLKIKNENCMEMDDPFMAKKISCEEDIKIEEMFCGDSELKKENVIEMDQLIDEIYIKTEECDFNSSPMTETPRTAIYAPRHIKIQPLQHLSTSDLTAVRVECVVEGKPTTAVIASVYLPQDLATSPLTQEMENLVTQCLTHGNRSWAVTLMHTM